MSEHVKTLSVQPVVTGCEWEENGNGQWESTCGKSFEFIEGGPIANGFEFCCFCGLSLDELPYVDDDADEDERDDSPYCDCGSFPDEEEQASNRCSCCGKMVDP